MLKVRKYVVLIISIFISFNSLSFAAIPGDANDNGKLDLADAIIILQTLVGLRPADSMNGVYRITMTGPGTSTGHEADYWQFTQNGTTVTSCYADYPSQEIGNGTIINGILNMSFTIYGNFQYTGTYSNGNFSGSTNVHGSTYTISGEKLGSYTVNQKTVPAASINVDGNTNDWAGISPVIVDRTGDITTVSGCDITSVYVAKDALNFYVRLELGNGAPASNLYIGLDIYPQPDSKAGDKMIFINFPNSVSVDSRNQDGSGYHTFVASGTMVVNGSTVELSVPLSALNPATTSYFTVHDDADINNVETNLDNTERIILKF